MRISAPSSAEPNAGFEVTASGTADDDAFVFLYVQPDDKPCEATAGAAQQNGREGTPSNGSAEGGTTYSFTARFGVFKTGSYVVCGYLTQEFNGQPDAVATSDSIKIVDDSDDDGIDDDADKCPNERGIDERNGQPTADGCPIRDRDRDGVRDEEDRCPDQQGINFRTNERTADGCPIRDTDSDGVYDDSDRCPNEFGSDERTPNTRTADGCPIRDGDRDGLRDEDDRCPSDPGRDYRNGAFTADGCPIRDSDFDGVVDGVDKCPTQPGRDPATNQPTADGCTPPDGDKDRVEDAKDQCPLENAESGLAKKDPARPGCLESSFVFFFAENFDTFTGRKTFTSGTLGLFVARTTGILRAKSFKVTVTLSKASAKKAKLRKREIASTAGTIPATGESLFRDYKKPRPTKATLKKLKTLKKISFEYAYTVVLVNGETRTAKASYTLKKGKATPVSHKIFGSGTNAAGEEG